MLTWSVLVELTCWGLVLWEALGLHAVCAMHFKTLAGEFEPEVDMGRGERG